jgi:hypothetical protein
VRYERDHIEPKNPANQNLSRLVKWDAKDEEERPFEEVCLHRLGNLVLDTVSKGAAKGSRDFASRIPYYTGSGLLSQGELVSRFASQDRDWDVAAIRRRHEALMDFAMTL